MASTRNMERNESVNEEQRQVQYKSHASILREFTTQLHSIEDGVSHPKDIGENNEYF